MIYICMSWMQVKLPEQLNKMLRKFALENDLGSREKATIHILTNFLIEFYKEDKNER